MSDATEKTGERRDGALRAFQEDLSRRMREAASASASIGGQEGVALLPFFADGRLFAIPATEVVKTAMPTAMTRLPFATEEVAGIIGIDGGVFTVLDASALLGGRPVNVSLRARVLCLDASLSEAGGASIALLVERTLDVSLADGAMQGVETAGVTLPPAIASVVCGRWTLGGRDVLALDVERLLGNEQATSA